MIRIRPVVEAEYQAVADLVVTTYRSVFGDLGGYGQVLADVARRARDAVVLVASNGEGGPILGSITYVPGPGPYAEFDGDEVAGIRMLAVAPEARRRGVGAALVNTCVERARAEGRRRIVLHTTPAMVDAQRLYERLGFRRTRELDVNEPGFSLLGYSLDLSGSLDAGPGGEMGRR